MTHHMWNQKFHYRIDNNNLLDRYVMMYVLGISFVEVEAEFRLFRAKYLGVQIWSWQGALCNS